MRFTRTQKAQTAIRIQKDGTPVDPLTKRLSARRNDRKSGYDLIIVGAGFTGVFLALMCRRSGLRVAIIDREMPRVHPGRDGRVTALSAGSRVLLGRAGLWSELAPYAEPILDIRVRATYSRRGLRYRHDDLGNEPMGHMIENAQMRRVWVKALKNNAPEIDVFAPADIQSLDFDGPQAEVHLMRGGRSHDLQAAMIAAADGRDSMVRTAAGIGVRHHDYNQTALVFTVSHDQPHGHVAEEYFLSGGPFALLPMADHPRDGFRSGVVWSVPRDEATALKDCSPGAFTQAMATAVGNDPRGVLRRRGPLWTYPLYRQIAAQRTGPRLALIGDAAQVIHPLAGQGLNLGLRDASDLAAVLAAHRRLGLDIGAPQVLARYDRQRRLDALSLITATDGLNRLFSNDIPVLRRVRAWGLDAVDVLPPVKRWFQRRAMGYASPRLPMVDPLTTRFFGASRS